MATTTGLSTFRHVTKPFGLSWSIIDHIETIEMQQPMASACNHTSPRSSNLHVEWLVMNITSHICLAIAPECVRSQHAYVVEANQASMATDLKLVSLLLCQQWVLLTACSFDQGHEGHPLDNEMRLFTRHQQTQQVMLDAKIGIVQSLHRPSCSATWRTETSSAQ